MKRGKNNHRNSRMPRIIRQLRHPGLTTPPCHRSVCNSCVRRCLMARLAPTFLTIFALLWHRKQSLPRIYRPPPTWRAKRVPSMAFQPGGAKGDIAAHMTVVFGGKTIIDHEFIFEANNAKARMTDANGNTTLYDGKDAWAIPSTEANTRSLPCPDLALVLARALNATGTMAATRPGQFASTQRPVDVVYPTNLRGRYRRYTRRLV